MSKYQQRIADVLAKLLKSAPGYSTGIISDYRNKRPPVWTPDTLPFWCSKLPRAAKPINTTCLYALLSALVVANEHFNITNEKEILVITLLKAVEKIATMKWWVVGQKLVGDDKKGYTFEGLIGV